MAQLLRGGNAAVQALLYGDVHPGTQRFFESRQESGFDRLREGARAFIQQAQEKFGFMASDATRRAIRDVRKAANWAWHGDYVRPLRSIDDLQLASPVMRRYLMAEPTIRKLYQRQQISGYDGQYEDLQPGVLGEDHRDYRRVMNEIVVEEEPDENETNFWAHQYMDVLVDDEPPLDPDEQFTVLECWNLAKRFMLEGKRDPTSLYNATLD